MHDKIVQFLDNDTHFIWTMIIGYPIAYAIGGGLAWGYLTLRERWNRER